CLARLGWFFELMRRDKPGSVANNATGAGLLVGAFTCIAAAFFAAGGRGASKHQEPGQSSREAANRTSAAWRRCHPTMTEPTMHPTRTVQLGCADCHGGNASAGLGPALAQGSTEYAAAKQAAHVQPRDPAFKNRGALPERAFAKWLEESAEFVKFVNPGDLRVAAETCGAIGCHAGETRAVATSMMTHTGMLWNAALYNNGGIPTKNTRFGER